jgi:hypothetical protein
MYNKEEGQKEATRNWLMVKPLKKRLAGITSR